MPIITISRGTLSGGERLAREIHAKLGYPVISREAIIEAARRFGVEEDKLTNGIRSPASLWDRFTGQKERYILAIQATLAELIEKGDAIYHGNAGQFLLKGLRNVIRLRLVAPVEYRVQCGMIEHSVTREAALEHIHLVDEQRSKWVRQMYAQEWSDPSSYDLVFNLEHITIEAAADLVTDVAKRPEFKGTKESIRELHDFALQTRIDASLAFQSEFPFGAVEVRAHGGIAELIPSSFLEKHKEEVIQFVRGIQGVDKVTTRGEMEPMELTSDVPKAHEVMVPINGYPHIHDWITMKEAMVALGSSSVQLKDGHLLSPRYVLVLGQDDKLVGIVSRRDLLHGLTPQFRSMKQSLEDLVPGSGLGGAPMLYSWISLLSPAAVKHAQESVSKAMGPCRATVNRNADLSEVLSRMLQNAVDLVPVVDGEKVVGVVLMTDVFDVVAEYVVEHSADESA